MAQTVGYSSQNITAGATQIHTFGEVGAGVRFNVEASWAARSADVGDAFGGAYPYGNRVQIIEAYAERIFTPRGGLVVTRGGRYRTPFGISSASDHGYVGFLRPPLIRYDDYYGLANTFLEEGVDVVVGTPRLSVETSLGVPADVGEAVRRPGLDVVVRGQAAFGDVIVGLSHIRSRPYLPATFAGGHVEFTGVDVRWMRAGVQMRGEWIWGQPFDGTRTHGGYADLIVHRPRMGPVTAVMRAERLAYDAVAPFELYANRVTVGSRIRLLDQLSAQVGLVHQSRTLSAETLALDVGLTLSLRRDAGR
ncbi:MAG: hypothetical protein ABUS56_11760 [Acidobacteriota bacterium]